MKLTRAHIWPVILAVCIFFVSGQTHLATPEFKWFSNDKLKHFLVFGLLATSILRIPSIKERGWSGAVFAALIVSIYGGLDELHQSTTPGRQVEIADWVADSLGAATASVLYLKWSLYRRFLEFPVNKKGRTQSSAAPEKKD